MYVRGDVSAVRAADDLSKRRGERTQRRVGLVYSWFVASCLCVMCIYFGCCECE